MHSRTVSRYKAAAIYCIMATIGYMPGHILRKAMYRLMGMKIGKRSYIYRGAHVRHPTGIKIGDDVIVGHGCILDGRNGLIIRNNVNISNEVWLWSMQHDPQCENFSAVGATVVVESNVWLAGRVIVLPGVSLAEGTVVASGAVVTADTLPYTIVAGIPAKKIAARKGGLKYRLGDSPPIPFV